MYKKVRFSADYQIETHAPPQKKVSVNSIEFRSCDLTPQVGYFCVSLITINTHRLLYRLQGYQILFAPYTFVPQC